MSTAPAPALRISRRVLERYLLDDETPVVATRQHWLRLLEPFASALAALVAVGALVPALDARTSALGTVLWLLWFAVFGRALWHFLQWRQEWFVATDRRLLLVYGVFTQKVAMMPLNKVTDMNYGRSILGRLAGYGRFVLESAGQDQAMREIDWLPDPDEKYRRICAILFDHDEQAPRQARRPLRDPFAEDVETDPFETSDYADEGPTFADRFDQDVVRVSPSRQGRRQWEPVDRAQLPPDWVWEDDDGRRSRSAGRRRPVAVDTDPTPYR